MSPSEPWSTWRERWRTFQESYVPDRPGLLSAVAEHIAAWSGGMPVRLLDLCAGPGSVADAVVERLPTSAVVAVDHDPWLLELGRRTAAARASIAWVDADLRECGWERRLPVGRYDAVTLVSALPWLTDDQIRLALAAAVRLLASDGVVIVADELMTRDQMGPGLQHLRRDGDCLVAGGLTWAAFWARAAAVHDFRDLLDERWRQLGPRRASAPRSSTQIQGLLRNAGLYVTGEIWRRCAWAAVSGTGRVG